METITIRPRTEAQLRFFRDLLANLRWEAEVEPVPQRTKETLEGKVARLYAEGHYTEAEMKQFLSIPKRHRVDPFEIIDGGDVYYADRRNVDYVNSNIEQAHRDREEGRCMEKKPGESFDDFMERIVADESI